MGSSGLPCQNGKTFPYSCFEAIWSPNDGKTQMNNPPPIVQIYSVADAHSQEFLERLLLRHGLVIATDHNDTHWFVVVDCDGDDQAWWVFEFVMSIDVGAVLLHASSGRTAALEPQEPHEFA